MIDLDAMVASPGFLTNGCSYRTVLMNALGLIDDPDRWHQGTFAIDHQGRSVAPTDPTACRWCFLGALARCSNEIGLTPPQLLRFVADMMHYVYGDQFASVGELNDYLSHEKLLEFGRQCLAQFS